MKKNIKQIMLAVLAVPILALGASQLAPVAHASGPADNGMAGGAKSAQGKDQQGQAESLFGDGSGNDGIFKTIINVLLFLIGSISVIMLIVGGIRYVVSGGDSSAVQSAKNTILYAIVGVVIAILAYAVVDFVITSFAANGGSS